MMMPTNVARVGEVVGVGTEDDVLHPGADVRGEGAQEDDAEGPVRQGGPRRARPGRDGGVPVDDGVLDLLDGDGAVVALGGLSDAGGTGPSYGRPSGPVLVGASWLGAGLARAGAATRPDFEPTGQIGWPGERSRQPRAPPGFPCARDGTVTMGDVGRRAG